MNQSQAAALTPDVAENKKEDRMLAALTARPPAEIDEPLKNTTRKTVALSTVIRRSLSVDNPAIMFASAYVREGAPGIAFQTARSAAIQTTGKVLYIHASDRIPGFFREVKNRIPVSLDDFANTGGRNAIPFVVLKDSGLVCAYFRGGPDGVKE